MSAIARRASLRFLTRHKGQLALAVLGIALGVAVVISVELAKNSALEAFDKAVEAVVGRATHRIIGGSGGLAEEVYAKIRLSGLVEALAPRVEGFARFGDGSGPLVRILGIDPVAERQFESDWYRYANQSEQNDNIDLLGLMTEPGAVIVAHDTAMNLGIKKGQTFNLLVGTQYKKALLNGILPHSQPATEQALKNLLIADIATVQEILGLYGRLTYIDLIEGDMKAGSDRLEKIKISLPEDAEFVVQGSGQREVREMTQAFYTNLTSLSVLSLLVGMFLIYNTITFLVLQRRELFGSLRALGVTPRQVLLLVLSEAVVIGLISSLLGMMIGIGLSHIFLRLISITLNQAFFFLMPPGLAVSPQILVAGILLGLVATVVSALRPAIEASRYAPLQIMRRSRIEVQKRVALSSGTAAGLAVLLGGIAILYIPVASIAVGFIGQLVFVVGFAMLTPVLAVAMMTMLRPLISRAFGVMGSISEKYDLG